MLSSQFILYAAVFRIAIIAAGTLFMFLGYRLFVLGVMPPEGTNIDGQAGEVRLSVKNAAPGTCFALFGLVLIGLMVWNGNPELVLRQDGERSETVLRGPALVPRLDVDALLEDPQEDEALIRGFAGRLEDPSLSLGDAVEPILGLATVYHRAGRNDEAIALARLVYQFAGDDAELLKIMARVQAARGERRDAELALRRLRSAHPARAGEADAIAVEVLR